MLSWAFIQNKSLPTNRWKTDEERTSDQIDCNLPQQVGRSSECDSDQMEFWIFREMSLSIFLQKLTHNVKQDRRSEQECDSNEMEREILNFFDLQRDGPEHIFLQNLAHDVEQDQRSHKLKNSKNAIQMKFSSFLMCSEASPSRAYIFAEPCARC